MATRLFVGKLTDKATSEELTSLFSANGPVTQVDVKNGYAFVYFENSADAHEAVSSLNGHVLDDQPIVVEHARTSNRDYHRGGKPVKRLDLRLLVLGIDSRISWQDLKDWARQAGDVTFTNVYTRDDVPKGIVEFASPEGMEAALAQLPDVPLNGVTVTLQREDPENPTGGDGGGGGGRGYRGDPPPYRGGGYRDDRGPRGGGGYGPPGGGYDDRDRFGRGGPPPYRGGGGYDRGGPPMYDRGGPHGGYGGGPPGYDRHDRLMYDDRRGGGYGGGGYSDDPRGRGMPPPGYGGGGGGYYPRDRSRSRSPPGHRGGGGYYPPPQYGAPPGADGPPPMGGGGYRGGGYDRGGDRDRHGGPPPQGGGRFYEGGRGGGGGGAAGGQR